MAYEKNDKKRIYNPHIYQSLPHSSRMQDNGPKLQEKSEILSCSQMTNLFA